MPGLCVGLNLSVDVGIGWSASLVQELGWPVSEAKVTRCRLFGWVIQSMSLRMLLRLYRCRCLDSMMIRVSVSVLG